MTLAFRTLIKLQWKARDVSLLLRFLINLNLVMSRERLSKIVEVGIVMVMK